MTAGTTVNFEDMPTEEAWPALTFDEKDLEGIDQQLHEDGFRYFGTRRPKKEGRGSRVRRLLSDVMGWS